MLGILSWILTLTSRVRCFSQDSARVPRPRQCRSWTCASRGYSSRRDGKWATSTAKFPEPTRSHTHGLILIVMNVRLCA